MESGDATWDGKGYSNVQENPVYFTRNGDFASKTLNDLLSNGVLWTGTIYSAGSSYRLDYRNNVIYIADTRTNYTGCPVRCITRNPTFVILLSGKP